MPPSNRTVSIGNHVQMGVSVGGSVHLSEPQRRILYLVSSDLLLDCFSFVDPTKPAVVFGPFSAVVCLATATASAATTAWLLRSSITRCNDWRTLDSLIS